MTYDDPLARELMTARDRELFPESEWLPPPVSLNEVDVLSRAIKAAEADIQAHIQERMVAALEVPASFLQDDPSYTVNSVRIRRPRR